MSVRFPNFEVHIDRTILARGQSMYQDGSITQIDAGDDHEFVIYVQSERLNHREYKVKIQIDAGEVIDFRCNCPFQMGPICKHIVAGLYEIRENGHYESSNEGSSVSGDEDDSEEDEEVDDDLNNFNTANTSRTNSRPVSRQNSSQKKTKKKFDLEIASQETRPSQKPSSVPTEAEIEEKIKRGLSVENMDNVEKEFHCQICLGDMTNPVSMACNAHSMCYECALIMFQHQKKEAKGHKLLSCPTCREGSGILRLKKPTDLKINLELKRIKEAYEFERRIWLHEKILLKQSLSQAEEAKSTQSSATKKEMRGAKSKEMDLEDNIKNMDKKNLESLAVKILVNLQAKGANVKLLMNKVSKDENEESEMSTNGSGQKRIDGSALSERLWSDSKRESKITLRRKTMNEDTESGSKEERYPLRSLKRMKTTVQ